MDRLHPAEHPHPWIMMQDLRSRTGSRRFPMPERQIETQRTYTRTEPRKQIHTQMTGIITQKLGKIAIRGKMMHPGDFDPRTMQATVHGPQYQYLGIFSFMLSKKLCLVLCFSRSRGVERLKQHDLFYASSRTNNASRPQGNISAETRILT